MILLRFLLFRTDAIRTVAADRRFLGVGFLLVISAALAREYDGEDLLHEPWYLLIPIAVSTAMGTCLACGLWLVMPRAAGRAYGFGTFWRRIQTCYWMTAPLAWLYAVPYERFLSELGSVEANLWTLKVVAVWRFALMLRCILLLLEVQPLVAIVPLGFFVSVATLIGIALAPIPFLIIMAGIRLPAAVATLAQSQFFTQLGASLSLFVCGIGTIIAVISRSDVRRFRELPPAGSRVELVTPRYVAVGVIVILLACLPFTQPEQVLRRSVERAVDERRYAEALQILSAHQRSEFPPYWTPPPPPWDLERFGEELELLKLALKTDVASWVREEHVSRFRELWERSSWSAFSSWWENPEALADVLDMLPEGRTIAVSILESRVYIRSDKERNALNVLARRLYVQPESQPVAE